MEVCIKAALAEALWPLLCQSTGVQFGFVYDICGGGSLSSSVVLLFGVPATSSSLVFHLLLWCFLLSYGPCSLFPACKYGCSTVVSLSVTPVWLPAFQNETKSCCFEEIKLQLFVFPIRRQIPLRPNTLSHPCSLTFSTLAFSPLLCLFSLKSIPVHLKLIGMEQKWRNMSDFHT